MGDRDECSSRSVLAKQRRKEGQKTVWFKEIEDSSDIEVEIIPDSVGRVAEETEDELEGELEMKEAARESDGESTEEVEERDDAAVGADKDERSQEQEG